MKGKNKKNSIIKIDCELDLKNYRQRQVKQENKSVEFSGERKDEQQPIPFDFVEEQVEIGNIGKSGGEMVEQRKQIPKKSEIRKHKNKNKETSEGLETKMEKTFNVQKQN